MDVVDEYLPNNLTVEFWVTSVVGVLSMVSGCITCLVGCHQSVSSRRRRRTRGDHSKRDVQHSSSPGLVSARLPSLIRIEIMLMVWYLVVCNPLMLLFWYYLPFSAESTVRFGDGSLWEICGSVIFTVSFIPILTTHIIRLWILR